MPNGKMRNRYIIGGKRLDGGGLKDQNGYLVLAAGGLCGCPVNPPAIIIVRNPVLILVHPHRRQKTVYPFDLQGRLMPKCTCVNVIGDEYYCEIHGGDFMNKMPTIVCLCGSTRFGDTFAEANLKETLAGKIVLSIGVNTKSDDDLFGDLSQQEFDDIKAMLDELHLRKIDLAHEVFILNVSGYVGESTRREYEYAKEQGKLIRWWEPDKALE